LGIALDIETMDGQDWTSVTLRNTRKASPSAAGGPGSIPKNRASDTKFHQALDDHDFSAKPLRTLSPETRQQIIQLRVANKWTQADLENQCSFPKNTVRDIEAGKATPSPMQLNIMNRVLKASLKFTHINLN
jgi:ribosome-binding protein aMBF1 (putative translation factor)